MRKIRYILLTLLVQAVSLTVCGQEITSVHGTVSDDLEPLIGAAVCEIDGNGRIIEPEGQDPLLLRGYEVGDPAHQQDHIRHQA